MIVVLSDTHRSERPALDPELDRAVRRADRLIHAGDFTTEAVVDGFQSRADTVLAVAGNRDSVGVSERLPSARTFSIGEFTVALTHRQSGGQTGLSYFGTERDADLVISGHTHRPHAVTDHRPALLNPGSHADPRGGEPTYATLEVVAGDLEGTIYTTGGKERESFRVEGRNGTATTAGNRG